MSEKENIEVSKEAAIKEICVASPKGETIFVEAASRLSVPHEGRMVPDVSYWHRCISHGNVVKLSKIGGKIVKKQNK